METSNERMEAPFSGTLQQLCDSIISVFDTMTCAESTGCTPKLDFRLEEKEGMNE